MRQTIIGFNRMLLDHLMFKSNDKVTKLVTGFIYFSLISPLFILKSSSIAIKLVILMGQIIVMYLLYLFLYLTIEIPNKVFFSEIGELCDRVESIFKSEFYKYNSFLADHEMPQIETFLNTNAIPQKNILFYWKYRLSTKSESIQTIAPIIGLLIFAAFRYPLFSDIFQKIINNFVSGKEIPYFKSGLEMLTYPYLFLIYHSNINRINFCIDKIEFLVEICY